MTVIDGVEIHDGWLRVAIDRGHADFHLRWLRHNCDVDRHPVTGERIVCSSDLPDTLRARRAWVEGGVLHVRWDHEERTSRFALGWLADHAYGRDRDVAPPPPNDPSPLTLVRRAPFESDLAAKALELVGVHGAVVVRRDRAVTSEPEDETEALVDAFAGRGLSVVGTHFGRIEDLRTDNTTNANTDQLGYTDAPIDLHTDQPFLEEPPRYQLLQCIRPADEGGDNDVVDALAAARHLRSVDREAYERLTATAVVFDRRQKAFERRQVSPILSGDGDTFRVRFSYFTMAPHRLLFDEMESFYRAYDRFARLVRDPRHRIRVSLAAGDFLFYDNHRMLHARTGFRGARWLRGVYFDAR